MTLCYAVPGMLWPSEQSWIHDRFSKSKDHLEVGVYCGRSMLATAMGNRTCSIVGVDNQAENNGDAKWTADVRRATIDLIRRKTTCKVEMILKHSMDAFRDLAQRGSKFDSVFIDACHFYAECKADIEAFTSLIRPGGIIAGHDYWPQHPGVMEAVNETGPFNVVSGTRIWWRLA